MGEPEQPNLVDNEVPRRTDLNPFRDYPADTSEGRLATRQSSSGSLPSQSQDVRDLMERRDQFINAYNSSGISEDVRQTLHAEVTRIDRLLTANLQRQEARSGLDEVSRGLGCLLLAGAATLIGYLVADPGESYYLFWGGLAIGHSCSSAGCGECSAIRAANG